MSRTVNEACALSRLGHTHHVLMTARHPTFYGPVTPAGAAACRAGLLGVVLHLVGRTAVEHLAESLRDRGPPALTDLRRWALLCVQNVGHLQKNFGE